MGSRIPAIPITRPDVACDRTGPTLVGADKALGGFNAQTLAVFNAQARDFAILDDVDAVAVGGSGITPGDRVMAGRAGAALHQPPLIGKRASSKFR